MKLIKALRNKTIEYFIVANTESSKEVNEYILSKIKENNVFWFRYRLLSFSKIQKLDMENFLYSFKITRI